MSELHWTVILGIVSMVLGIALNLAIKPRIHREVAE
jgi:hypothetical protein